MEAPLLAGAVHSTFMPPVAASMLVEKVVTWFGTVAAKTEVIGEKAPQPHRLRDLILNWYVKPSEIPSEVVKTYEEPR